MAKRSSRNNGTSAAEVESVQEVQMGNQTEKVTELPVVRFCECGCGQSVVGKKAKFRPGHDAVYKGQLLLSARAGNAEARATLIERGWATDESIDKVAAKGKATEEQKRERERAKVAAKLERAKAEVERLESELAELG